MTGIYKIENLQNGKVYIGESLDIERRWDEHKHELINGTHHSYKLQQDFNNMGKRVFKFDVLEEITISENNILTKLNLVYLEDKYIKKYNSIEKGYNIENTIYEILHGNKTILDTDKSRNYLFEFLKKKNYFDQNIQKLNDILSDSEIEINNKTTTINTEYIKKSKPNYRKIGLINIFEIYEEFILLKIIDITFNSFKNLLIKKKMIIQKEKLYYATENAKEKQIFVNNTKIRRGKVLNTIIVTQFGKEFLKNKFKELYATT